MEKSKKFRMPAGIRNKLTAAVAMLLVSSIMMVSSTYAWFTLSTAPEVTGITTSVGANGNLEMALLTTDTFGNLTAIGSSVGDSSAAAGKTVKDANITWGNLVDLSSGYGLNDIALLPAALNTQENGNIYMMNPLVTAQYGADGRVSDINGQTVSAIANENGAFAYDGATQTYGVRAIGVVSNLSVREIALKNAKSVVNGTISSAKSATKSAIYTNMNVMLSYAMAAKDGSEPESYTNDDLKAFLAIANGVVTDLNTLESGYKNAAIAYAASTATDDDDFAAKKAALELLSLGELASQPGMGALSTSITALADAKANAESAQATLAAAVALGVDIQDESTTPTFTDVNNAIKLLVSDIDASGTSFPVTAYIAGGAVGELGAQVGTFEVASVGSMGTVYAGANGTATGAFAAVVEATADLSVTGAAAAASNITDTYGYIIDFAFRTNAAESNLQLQTSAVNRVYTDQTGADLATQGSGSTVTYVYHPDMTVEQVNKMLGAIRLLFINAADGAILQTGKLTDIAVNDSEATANVKLDGQTGDVGTIVALAQNQATAISVLVYLDGYAIDNTAVPNAASSGMLNLNLQFSSSAELIPMQNTALEQMTAYTVSFDANGGFGYMADVRAAGEYTVPVEPNFTRTNYQFKGWAKTATISAETELITAPFELTANTTLYAIWEPAATYAVSFAAGEGSGDMATVTVVGGEKYTLPACTFTAPADKVFGGWLVGEQTLQPGAKITVTEATTVTATWVDEPVVDDPDAGEQEDPSEPAGAYTVNVGEHVTADKATANEGDIVTLTIEEGYVVTVTQEGGDAVTVTDNQFTMPAGNVTVVAYVDGAQG